MPVDRSASDLLTEGQQAHLSASMERVENALGKLAALTTGSASPEPALMSQVLSDLPPGFDAAIQEPLARARTLMAEIVATLALRPYQSSARATAGALVMSSLVIIEDAFSRTLRGYGEIHPRLPGVLDPALERLHHEVMAVREALRTQAPMAEVEDPAP